MLNNTSAVFDSEKYRDLRSAIYNLMILPFRDDGSVKHIKKGLYHIQPLLTKMEKISIIFILHHLIYSRGSA